MSTPEYRKELFAKFKKKRFKRIVLRGLPQLVSYFKVAPVKDGDVWVVEYKGKTFRNPSPVQAMRDLATVNGYLTRQIEADPEILELAIDEIGYVTLSSGEPPYVISDILNPEMVSAQLGKFETVEEELVFVRAEDGNTLEITALSAGEEGETYITVSDSFEPVDSIEIEVKIG